jgi:two-component system response regulator RegX3
MGGSLRVFVVEDHAATARGLEVFLETSGYDVEVANDVRSALNLAKRITFDVLLCDLSLPDGTGWDLMKALRQRAPVRGIAFSALDDPEDIKRSKAAGFADHVVKGTAPEELISVIDRVTKNKADVNRKS